VLVAASAGPSLRNDDARSRVREVCDELFAVEDLRPDGNGQERVLSARAVRETATADAAATGTQLLVRAETGEIPTLRIGDEHDVTAVTAVSSVGAATRHVLLAPEMDRAVTAAAGHRRQFGAVMEHRAYRNGK
jgi:hypothetical protein